MVLGESRSQEKKPTKLGLIIGAVVLVVAIIGGTSYYFWSNSHKDENAANDAAKEFTTALKKQNFKKVSQLVSPQSLKAVDYTKESLMDKYTTIFDGIGASNIEIKELKVEPVTKNKEYKMSYTMNVTTSLGELKPEKHEAKLTKAGDDYLVDWDAHLIFSKMEATDKISVTTTTATRGEILDKNGEPLANLKKIPEAGIVPNDLGEGDAKTEAIKTISEKLSVPVETIEKKLGASWVKPELLVPIKVMKAGDTPVIPGVQYTLREMRNYPLNEAAAHLIGYVGEVSAEDIEKNKSLNAGDIIGKSGLEAAKDKELRGKNGGRIVINDKDQNLKAVLQEVDKVEGKTITLTIDSKIQKQAYDQIQGQKGSAVMMNPTDGSLMALVSSPSYDANLMTSGISSAEYDQYANDKNLPFLARYASNYAPGSTFKTITAGIGLDAGITTPDKTHDISGLKWQKDSSWGDYFVTRVSDVPTVNMTQALVYSDNIYFAQEGLAMGKETFEKGLNKFIFGETLDLPIAMDPAQVANKKGLNSDILLADTAYGQGQLLMSPIQQAVSYTPFADNGQIMYPKLLSDQKTAESKQAITDKSATIVKDALIETVNSPQGTAHTLAIPGHQIAAKTGTAELKEKQDTKGDENAFLLAFDADNNNYLLVAMLEGGTSRDVISRMRPVLEGMY